MLVRCRTRRFVLFCDYLFGKVAVSVLRRSARLRLYANDDPTFDGRVFCRLDAVGCSIGREFFPALDMDLFRDEGGEGSEISRFC